MNDGIVEVPSQWSNTVPALATLCLRHVRPETKREQGKRGKRYRLCRRKRKNAVIIVSRIVYMRLPLVILVGSLCQHCAQRQHDLSLKTFEEQFTDGGRSKREGHETG